MIVDFSGVEHEVGGPMSIDALHVKWIAEFLGLSRPREVIEIGSCAGVSTRAITAAYDRNIVSRVHLVDTLISESVRVLADDRKGFRIHEMPSTAALPEIDASEDLVVVVDGDHSLGCVMNELPLVLDKNPRAIIAHDVTAEAAGYSQCDGARWLLIACRDDDTFDHAAKSWRQVCGD